MPLNLNNLAYPFDPTGSLASNLITGEQQILTAVNWTDYQFIMPRWAPFFYDSLVVNFTDTQGNSRTLVEGVDYYACFEFISASRACAKPIWGGVQFINPLLSGVVSLQYQTLGGIWTLDTTTISQLLADRLANPRISAWEQVVNQPVMFPVIDHEWDLVDLVGASDIVTALGGIEDMLRQTGQTGLAAHLADFTNPHRVTAAQVGLGNVQNYGIAQPADLTAGTSNTVYMTPAGTTTMMNNGPTLALNNHIANHSNPHQVTAAQVGTYTSAQIDQLLAGYTPSGGAAANALLFNGMDAPTYRDWALSTGVASNSLQFGGQTPAQFTASVLGGTAANSNALAGYTYAQVISNALAGKAADTFKFNGMDANTFANWVLANGTAANSAQFNGMTPAAYAAWVQANTTASNSNLLQGMTVTQIENQILNQLGGSGGVAKQVLIPATSGETGTTYWEELGQLIMPSALYPAANIIDAHWILQGGNSNGNLVSSAYYVHISNETGTPAMEVQCLTAVDAGAVFGYNVVNVDHSDGNGAVPTMRVWMQTGKNMGQVMITRLNADSMIYVPPNRISASPTGFTAITSDRFALESEVTAVLNQLTTSFNSLATQIAAA
jgi:hypothetical protein